MTRPQEEIDAFDFWKKKPSGTPVVWAKKLFILIKVFDDNTTWAGNAKGEGCWLPTHQIEEWKMK